MTNLIDSYSDSNTSFYWGITTAPDYFGQSFTCSSVCTSDHCDFVLRKFGTPTGTLYAQLYSHSGVYGTSSSPSTLLATSDSVNIASVPTSWSDVSFYFSGANRVNLSASTYYVIVLYFSSIVGDVSNYIAVGVDNTSPTASGNEVLSSDGTNWTVGSGEDMPFYFYGNDVSPSSSLSPSSSVSPSVWSSPSTSSSKSPSLSVISE